MVCDNTIMHIIKKLTLGLCASLLVSSLFTFGLGLGLLQTFGSPGPIKNALREGDFYETFVGHALEQAQKEQGDGGQEKIPINNPEVQKVIKDAVSPELLRGQLEGGLDAAYAWLQGKTPKLEFVVRLDQAKTNLANGISDYAEKHLASLPTCTSAPSTTDVDPFSATCLPKGVKPNQVAKEAKNEVLNGDFLKDPTIDASNLKGKDGVTLEEQLRNVPAAYQAVKWATYGTGLLAVLMAVAVVFLSDNWRKGLKKVSINSIVVGALVAGLSWLAGYGLARAAEAAKEPLQQSGVKVGEHLANDLRMWWLWYGIGLIVAGIITLVGLHFTKPKTPESDKDPIEPAETSPVVEDKPKTAAAPPARPKSKPSRKLVQ
jgi:hypothetical protein